MLMQENETKLYSGIMVFLDVVNQCYKNTSFTGDREIFARDLSLGFDWLCQLNRSAPVKDVLSQILDDRTEKQICEYWRQGEWGSSELKAFQDLKLLAASLGSFY